MASTVSAASREKSTEVAASTVAAAMPGQYEHRLHEQCAGDEFGDAGADQGEHRQHSGAQGVAEEHGALAQSPGAGAAYRILGQGVGDALAYVEEEPRQLGDAEDGGGQRQV